jgi:hypothetical protein
MNEVEYTREELAFLTLIGAAPKSGKASVEPDSTNQTIATTETTKAEDN